MLRPKQNRIRDDWRKFQNEKVHNECSQNVIRILVSGRIRGVKSVESMEENCTKHFDMNIRTNKTT
jgi:hypothetical protein